MAIKRIDDKSPDEPCPVELGVEERLLLRDELERKLRECSTRERTVILLYHFDRLTLREIAEVLELDEEFVAETKDRAMARIGRKR